MKEVWNNLQLYYPCKRRSWKKWWKAFGRRTLRSSLEKGRKRPAAFFLAAALYQVLIQKWKQPKIKGWSFLKHTLIAGVLPFQKKKVQNFIFIFCCRVHNCFFHSPDPRSDGQWRSRIQVYFNSRPLGDALTRELAQEWGGATSLDFVHFVCKSKKECSIRWMKFILTWFACFKEKRSQVTLLDSWRKIAVRGEFFPSLFMTG